MKDLSDHKKIAFLVDADNAQHTKIKKILSEVSKHGHVITKRAYGDWSSAYLKGWKAVLNELAIQPMQQFAYTTGKNATDASLIIDAMDLLYTKKYDAFAIISSDSDFTPLASRLREDGVNVIGIGESKTPPSFRNSCDDFIFTENLEGPVLASGESEPPGKGVSPSPREPHAIVNEIPEEIIDILYDGWQQYKEDEFDEWANVAPVGSMLKRIMPDFDPRTYGVAKIPELIAKIDIFEMNKFKGSGGVNIVAYRPVANVS